MNKEEARKLAQTIRSVLPMIDVTARGALIADDYHVIIKLPSEEQGFLMNSVADWEHFQALSSLLSCSLLSASLPRDVRPHFRHTYRWLEGLRLDDPLPSADAESN